MLNFGTISQVIGREAAEKSLVIFLPFYFVYVVRLMLVYNF